MNGAGEIDLPQNVEAEAALLGAMMQSSKVIDPVADKLSEEHFFEPLHGRIFSAIVSLHNEGKSANAVTLKPYFQGDASMQELGGPVYLAQLSGSGATLLGVSGFTDQILELAQRRGVIQNALRAIEASANCETPLDELAVMLDEAAGAVREAGDGAGEYSAAEALQLVVDAMETPVTGAQCGIIPSIDALLGPMRPTHLVIGAGRPGMGKTATAISYSLGAARRGHGVLFISLEMGAEQLAERMAADLCLENGIPYSAIRDRTLSVDQKREVCRALEAVRELPLQVLDKHGLTVEQIRTLVRRQKRRFEARGEKLELVVIDYLQLVRTAKKTSGPYEAVSEVSRTLKEVAKENGVAVFALAQLSREVEKRADKRPLLSDLRESGQIEQDADAVIFFLRPEYYLRQAEPMLGDPKRAEWERDLSQCEGLIEFICAKRRNGRSGSRVGQFHGAYQAVRG